MLRCWIFLLYPSFFVPSIDGWSFGWSLWNSELKTTQRTDTREDWLTIKATTEEHILLDHGLQLLDMLQYKEQDCFRRSALSLRKGCQALSLTETDTIRYAVLLTLCELSTAKIPIPQQCQHADSLSDNQLESCIMTFAAVPQMWTSYSGYFRDVVSMCFAVRYPIERELLETLHEKITMNQLKNYELLRAQQQDLSDWHQQETEQIHVIQHAQKQLHQDLVDIGSIQQRVFRNISEWMQMIVVQQEQAEAVWKEHDKTMRRHMEEGEAVLETFMNHAEQAMTMIFITMERNMAHLHANAQLTLKLQNDAFNRWEQFETMQSVFASRVKDDVHMVNQTLSDLLNETSQEIQDMQKEMESLHTQLSFAFAPVQRLVKTLKFSYDVVRTWFRFRKLWISVSSMLLSLGCIRLPLHLGMISYVLIIGLGMIVSNTIKLHWYLSLSAWIMLCCRLLRHRIRLRNHLLLTALQRVHCYLPSLNRIRFHHAMRRNNQTDTLQSFHVYYDMISIDHHDL